MFSLPAPKDAPLSQGGAIDGEIVAHGHGGSHNQIFMKILPVYVTGPKGTEKVYAFLDEGSTITMMTSSLAERLGLDGPGIPLYWQGAGPLANTDLTSKTVECRVRGFLPNAKEYLMQRVRTVFELNLPRQTVDMSALSRDWRHLADGQVQSLKDAVPELLIGLDNTPLIVSREIIHGPWNAPYLVRTWLGWVVMGKIDGRPINGPKNYSMWERRDDLYEMVKDSFSIDSFGAESLGKAPSREDKRALEIMERTTHRTDDGRFETGLLWKDGKQPAVPESKEAALRRLHATERKLDRDPELAEAYCAKMEDHIQKKYLVKLTEEDLQVPMENVWYLPHFSVFHPAKKKIRVVFDCAAKSHGFSLNDFLTKGPDLLKSLPGVLENFRKGKYAFTGDIREMFHRVHVRKDDTNYQRILYRGMRRDVEPDEYKMDVMTFGASCSPTLASYVKNVNAEEHAMDYPEAVKGILDNTYCDDYLGSADSIEDARKLIRDIVYVQKAGGFDIVNWTANDSRILDTFTDTMKNLASQTLDELDRVLGLWWDSTADIFTFKTQFHRVPAEILSGEKIPTMRDVLRLIMSIFDPLGFLAMFTVKGKMILQEIWRLKIGWDDPIEGIALQHWKTFLDELKTISTVRVSRCYSPNLPQATSVQLHIFGDASEHAYSSVAYLRIVSEINSEIEVSFVCARTKVSPLKSTSIPRLELQAAVMSSRMSAAIRATLDVKIDDVVLWSDSLTVLGWIRSDSRRFKQFVGHRISEIDELTEFRQWRWVPTKLNPADLATRMVKSDFSESSMWFCGPPFLRQLESGWPREKSETIENKTNDVEVFTVMTNVEVFRGDQLMPKIERFSQWNRLIRVTATAMICAKYWLDRWKVKKSGGCPPKRPTLTVKDLLAAEKQWFRKIQTEFWAEIETLKRGESVDKQSPLLTLSPTLDSDGILRIDSRLVNSDVREKYPVILAQKHPATKLLIKDAHERHHHQGREQVVNYLRERFHIPRVRVAVKRAWHECQQCKNQRARPVVPEMAALPRFRVTDSVYPFVRSGVDYFGPLMVKVGRRHEKRWGVLFTCLATRAVHLEIAHSLTTDSAIMAIRRFLGRRGPISDLVCDNGTNLRGADNEFRHLYQALETGRMTEALSERKIDFHFNPPAAPHMGGAWERLIRSVKNVLKDLLKNHVPTDEELLTLFTEVEFIVNGRPLTYVSVEPEDDTALTPNHFLIGRSAANRPIGNFDDGDLVLRKAWRKSQRIADMFWHRWVHEYLPELTRRTKWHQKIRPLKIGDIVVICDEQLPRNSWPLGRVTDVFTAPDGKIRSVMVKTAQGLYRRPVAKLALLDVAEDQQTGLGMGAGAPERGNVGNATTPTSGII
ncbi:uncharacterized protein LOC129805169 [Phlebotomus papatasi]|uniref:uncharacterized protein LOC129805169 n=1 Tax=Phlebotomus papatasi TaxID=29031 RepID=UPI0024843D06|nr:uncharacterized protein LOC129805169 [Phlebotomus papatasi]